MKNLFIYIVLLTCGILFLQSCDSTTSPDEPLKEQPAFTDLSVTPNQVQFIQERDGFNEDTTITINISVQLNTSNEATQPEYSVYDQTSSEVVVEGTLNSTDSNKNIYSANLGITTSTISFEDFIVNVFLQENPDVYAQSMISIKGYSNNPPIILETQSPDTIYRPESGEIPATFKAKVTDEDGHSTLDRVLLRVINDQSGEVQGSPFPMFDDGFNFGDEVAGDSVYTWSLPVTPTDINPNRDFTIEFYAIDQAGLTSEIHQTTFSIRE